MKSSTNFLIIKDEDLTQLMPDHFTDRYGLVTIVDDVETKAPRQWCQLEQKPTIYEGGTPKLTIPTLVDGQEVNVPCSIISMELSPSKDDFSYEAAFAYGQGMEAPFGQVCNLSEVNEIINQYQNTEIENP